jgi:hypothetical protein
MLPKSRKYEVATVEAVTNHKNVTLVHAPRDLPENIEFFIITISNGRDSRKIGRHSVTVPKNMRVSPKFHLKQAVLLFKSGSTEEIKDVLKPYVGYHHNFDHHEVGLKHILILEGFDNFHSISFLWSENSFFGRNFLTTMLL